MVLQWFLVRHPLDPMVFQWFSMVAKHWSTDRMVMIHRWGLDSSLRSRDIGSNTRVLPGGSAIRQKGDRRVVGWMPLSSSLFERVYEMARSGLLG